MSDHKVVCHAPGDRCLGCDHYHGKADKCKYATSTPNRHTPEVIEAAKEVLKETSFYTIAQCRLLAEAKEAIAGLRGLDRQNESIIAAERQRREKAERELAEARKDIADITEVWGHQITDYLEARHAARETGENG